MAYIPTVWKDDDLITAARMNKLEQGVANEQVGPAGKDGADGKDGAPGPAGTPGADGKDGVSPAVTVADIPGGHRVTITDASGPHSFDVMDGQDGTGGGTAGVSSFNGRSGVVVPQPGDYSVSQITGAAPTESPVFTEAISLGRKPGTAVGSYSFAVGLDVEASGAYCHAEGNSSSATQTGSYGAAHAEGYNTKATADFSHAEGGGATASGISSHAEGSNTTASGISSHAEGGNTTASGVSSHAEGSSTTASGYYSHAEGYLTEAKGYYSHASGFGTIANMKQFVVGGFNVEKADSSNDFFIVGGGGSASQPKNAFRVNKTGACYGSGAWNTSGADYAELFEWQDRNPASEDRAGLFVTLEGEHIRIATPEDDYVLGIVSATPSVVGDVYDDQWAGMYLRDVFGRTVMELQDFPAETIEVPSEDGQMKTEEIYPARQEMAPKVNPDYDRATPYQPRTQRPEWDAVGLLGKLVAVDDGSCQVNGWATVGVGGAATASPERTRYRVIARLDATHVRVMIL